MVSWGFLTARHRTATIISIKTMQKQLKMPTASSRWVPLSGSLRFMFRHKRLLGWSFLIIMITILLTWGGYTLSVDFIDNLTADFFSVPPASDTVWGWIKLKGWLLGSWFFHFVTSIISFYISFLLAYSLTTPGYAFLSTATEKIQGGDSFTPDSNTSFVRFFLDLLEGIKIGLLGILVTIAAIIVNFIPLIGQICVFLLYTYYSALMFIDYPASRRHWTLAKKIRWLFAFSSPSFRLGFLPALVSMIPLLNIFAIALLFPLLTIHATLNFLVIEQRGANRFFNP